MAICDTSLIVKLLGASSVTIRYVYIIFAAFLPYVLCSCHVSHFLCMIKHQQSHFLVEDSLQHLACHGLVIVQYVRTKRIYQKGLVLQYQLHNRVENLADVSTRCSGLLQGEDKLALAPLDVASGDSA